MWCLTDNNAERQIERSLELNTEKDGVELTALEQVVAVIGFHFLDGWYPEKIETVRLNAREVKRVGAGRAGIIYSSQSKGSAQRFLVFLSSKET
jgi:hypothetical protein